MEGDLQYYKGLVGGFKKVYALIDSSDFVAFKGGRPAPGAKELIRISLDNERNNEGNIGSTEVFPYGKDSLQFVLVCSGHVLGGLANAVTSTKKKKQTKHYFKAASAAETHLWLKCINKYTQNLDDDLQTAQVMALAESESQDDHARAQLAQAAKKVKPAKKVRAKKKQEAGSELYDAFHNRLFVDDCDLNVKIQALNEIQEMFKAETKSLQEAMKEEGKEEQYAPIASKVGSLANLSNTMDTFMANLLEDIDESRTQMFDILENIALEQQASKSKKKKVKKEVKPKPEKRTRKGSAVASSFLPKFGKGDERIEPGRPSRDLTSTFTSAPQRSSSMVKSDSKSGLPYDDLMVKHEEPKQPPVLDDGDLCFDENSNDDGGQLLLDSPKDSVNSSVLEYEDDEEEDEFEDAEEGISDEQSDGRSEEEIDTSSQLRSLPPKNVIIVDCPQERVALPCLRDPRIKPGTLLSILRDMVGKDMTKYSMPVILNEPLTNLQKNCEVFAFNHLLTKASKEESSLMRLVYVSIFSSTRFFLASGRLQKPFNPLLGETYEVVAPNYRAIAEQVSHHPPVMAMKCEGEGFTMEKTMQATVKFTGKSIVANDPNQFYVNIQPVGGAEETYTFDCPKILVGNLIIGEQYVEPQGMTSVVNHSTGEKCELEFKARGWTSKNKEALEGKIKTKDGKVKYTLTGKYTEKIVLTNTETGEVQDIWTAPPKPEKNNLMYGMNSFALQINLLTDALKEKLPPTDSRLRMDTRLWESGKQDESSNEKTRIEVNQRNRKKALKEMLGKSLEGNDSDYYTPKYFKKGNHPLTGEEVYSFAEKNHLGSNYWLDRDKGDWSHMPRIYEDDCKPFH